MFGYSLKNTETIVRALIRNQIQSVFTVFTISISMDDADKLVHFLKSFEFY